MQQLRLVSTYATTLSRCCFCGYLQAAHIMVLAMRVTNQSDALLQRCWLDLQ